MPSEMFERGRRDAEADALDENYYQYYYDYKLAYDEFMRNRRRTRRQLLLGRISRFLVRALPVLLVIGGAALAGYRYLDPSTETAAVPDPTATRVRPTLPPPTPRPTITPPAEPILRADGFALITGTQGAPLRARTAPGTESGLVMRIPEGTTVKVLGGPESANDMQWWQVELEGQSGWAAAPYLQAVPAPAR